MNYVFRPLGPWIEPTTSDRWGSHRFKAKWSDTLDLLDRELTNLGASEAVFQVDVRDAQLRRDGMLRADVKVGAFPGVRVSFESKHGPLTYATDAYEQQYGWALPSWQANVRAIALALEALRAVDRYGVSRRGEQYRGWTAIAARPAEMSREDQGGAAVSDFDPSEVRPGDYVTCRDAHGDDIVLRALSGLERAGHSFPVVRICRAEDWPDDDKGIPWPAEWILGLARTGASDASH